MRYWKTRVRKVRSIMFIKSNKTHNKNTLDWKTQDEEPRESDYVAS